MVRGQVDRPDLLPANDPAIRGFSYHHIPKLFRRSQTALSTDRIGELLVRGSWRAADLTSGVDRVLRLDRVDDLRNGDAQLRQLVWLYPESHRILACAENLHVADAVHAQDGIVEVDIGVVGQEFCIGTAAGRVYADQQEGGCCRLADGYAVIGDVDRKFSGGLIIARLSQNQIVIRVCLYIEVHDQRGLRVAGGVQGVHVVHVVHAVDFLLDGSGDGLLECLRVGADVGGLKLNLRWYDVRELIHRECVA